MQSDDLTVSARPRQRRLRPPAHPTEAKKIRGSTAASEVYRILRSEILSLERKPGAAINDRDLEATLGVSRTPIREAVLRLAAEGLIEVLPNSGTFVARIPLAQLPEAIIIRRTLEELTVRTAAERATAEHIAELIDNLAWQRSCVAAKDAAGFHDADEEFHSNIARAAGYPHAWPLVRQIKVQVDRYCHLTLPLAGRMARLIREHKAIADAVRDHDPRQAVAALGVHLDGILSVLSEPSLHEDYFIGELPDDIRNARRTTPKA
jgi:GntR family transcriptional regulator, rspAB operon transcriptional repressor